MSGSIRYEDKAYDNNGFTGATIFKPVRFATVEVVRCSDSQVLSSGASTDSDGGYSLVFTNTGTASVYLGVIAETGNAGIKNNTTDNAIYSVKSGTIDDSKGSAFTTNIDITVSSGAGGAFNILDILTDGILYLKVLVVTNPPLLTAFWQTNSCDGTYFDSSDNSIHLLGGCSGDTDEYDDDIILHEFGHFAAASFSRDDSPGGDHTLGDNTQDIRLAWSEGWAHFFSSAVRGVPSQTDTILNTASSFEIEGPSLFGSRINLDASSIYSTNEVSVATVLWDIFDNTNEAFDTLSLGVSPIWDVLTNYLTTATSVSFENFWDGWFVRGHGFQTEMINISSDRKMELLSDGFESDDSPNPVRKITVGATEHHTLYPAGDKDIVAFDVVLGLSYTIETLSLSNGADTNIEILDSNRTTVIASNDNSSGITYPLNCFICPPNDATTLSSKVQITPSISETLFVRVSRSASAPNSSGTYGSYDLRITSP
ncbi:MAG: hypothetical protein HZA13_05660 [Nitrospirae bacterium]|nr:hypothetical protein [Nitrospirota bacterium]